MHNLDRTQGEYFGETDEVFGEVFQEALSNEAGGGSPLQEVFLETGLQEAYGQELAGEGGELFGESTFEVGLVNEETGLTEQEEMQLASELLELNSEEELEQFLGRLFKRAWRGIRKVVPGVVRGIGGALRAVAKRALPMVGGALGSMVGGPLGGMVGSRLASGAGRLFGLELEGLSNEDGEYEIARRYVRFASMAARQAARSGGGNPAALRAALLAAARRHAPGLLGRAPTPGVRGAGIAPSCPSCARKRRGLWFRHGNRITLVGA